MTLWRWAGQVNAVVERTSLLVLEQGVIVMWVLMLLATAALSAVAGLLSTRAHPGQRLPWRGPLPPSWPFMRTEPWYSSAARWGCFLLGIFTASRHPGDHAGVITWLSALAAMTVPMSIVEGVHNHRLPPQA
jgi:hypothetical protein